MTIPVGLTGILAILVLSFLMSKKKSLINWRLIVSGLSIQCLLAVFCLKSPLGQQLFQQLGLGVSKLLDFSDQGAGFVFGFLVTEPEALDAVFGEGSGFIFAFKLIPTIIFVSTLVSIAYHVGVMQWVVRQVAWWINWLMGASGVEALSNTASIFVGQIEAQLLIKPYLATMTRSELLASMAGGMACIAGGIMAVYIQMGIPAEFLLTASVMAVPGALVISKLVLPETENSYSQGRVTLSVKKDTVNLIDAASRGASDGLRIGLNVIAMLIGFISLIALIDFCLQNLGLWLAQMNLSLMAVGLDVKNLSLANVLGQLFYWVAVGLGVPVAEAKTVASLMGTKLVTNEFVAYAQLAPQILEQAISQKSQAIASVALCGFANLGSVAMQVGGIGEMAPSRKKDLAKLGLTALLCGTLASYLSAALTGVLLDLELLPNFVLFGYELTALNGLVGIAVLGLVVSFFLPRGYRSIYLTAPDLAEFSEADAEQSVPFPEISK
ncbi:MAG: nucleoside transporter C-terminal domain-containing protein [Cyanobacteria bacterium P01_H01_bin.74]